MMKGRLINMHIGSWKSDLIIFVGGEAEHSCENVFCFFLN